MTSEGCNAYINDLTDFTEPLELNEKSEIAEFFVDTNVLVTGGTGFLGKLLVEKLLRSCPGISKLYMIVRPKKGQCPLERFEENFNEVIYNRLKQEQPDFLKKVVMIEGDGEKENYGLSPEDMNTVLNTNIIFHAAAIVRFDEKIRIAINVNVKGTKFLLMLAKKMLNFKAFVHVSTAFAHCIHKAINETHYKDVIDADKMLTLLDALDDEKLEKITPILLDKWPNTYVYTKALGENMLLKYNNDLPVCIVRPSIVISTYQEPIMAWTNNMYGATGVTMGTAIGVLRTLYCKSENIAEVIPADYVVANIISSAWDTFNKRAAMKPEQLSNMPDEEKVLVYNCVSSCQNPISWGHYMEKNQLYGREIPSIKVLWWQMLILNRYLFMHNICVFLFHLIPAAIVDTFAYLSGRKPMMLNIYKKIHKFSNVIHYFSRKEWKFRNDNVINLWQKMNSVDRKLFCFNTKELDWEDYFYGHIRGLRIYMFNDVPDTMEEAICRYRRLRIAHNTIITIFSLLVIWIVVSFISFLWSFCPLSH